MLRRPRLLLFCATAVVLVVALVLLFLWARGPVHSGNFARLKDGMALEEVEAILGPAHTVEPILRTPEDTDEAMPTGKSILRWSGAGREIVLIVHEDRTTSGAVMGWDNGLLGRLRRWLGI